MSRHLPRSFLLSYCCGRQQQQTSSAPLESNSPAKRHPDNSTNTARSCRIEWSKIEQPSSVLRKLPSSRADTVTMEVKDGSREMQPKVRCHTPSRFFTSQIATSLPIYAPRATTLNTEVIPSTLCTVLRVASLPRDHTEISVEICQWKYPT